MRAFYKSTGIVLISIITGACTDLTSVHATDIVQPASLANTSGAEALRLGALGTFYTAFGSATNSVVLTSGLISDEFYAGHPVSFASDADFRTWGEPSFTGPYVLLQQTRIAALQALNALEKYAPAPASKTGHMFAVVGYAEVLLGETVCSGIPLGGFTEGGPVFGTPLTTPQLLSRAISDFDSALTYAADSARILNFARIGRGRALLDNAQFTEASAAVAAVPTNFVFNAEFSASLSNQTNGLFQQATTARFVSVSDVEGSNGLNFRSANDPRVPTAFVGKGADNISDIYQFTKITGSGSPIVLASGVEARLIQAEAQLNAGDAAGALATLNQLRASAVTPALAPLSLQPDRSSQVDQLFRERAFWLFGTGHRQGDLRRLIRQYGRSPEAVFPTGQARPGIPYGSKIVFAPDVTAPNNPAYTACASFGA